MSIKTMITAGLVAGAVVLAASNAAKAEVAADKEKCYGVAKQGKNDCASADKAHSCMGHATVDASANEWIALPAGVCDKLAGGSLTPAAAAAGGDAKATCDGKSDCAGHGK
jgi:uncharacterized membrane protein